MASNAAGREEPEEDRPKLSLGQMPITTDVGPGPQVKVSYQDSYSHEIDDDANTVDESDDEYQQLMEEAMNTFSEEEVENMMEFLKERGA